MIYSEDLYARGGSGNVVYAMDPKNKEKEYAFLLSRKLRRTNKPHDPVSHDDLMESRLNNEASWYIRNRITLPNNKRPSSAPVRKTGLKEPSRSTTPTQGRTKATSQASNITSHAKLRKTCMSVGYVHNAWPESNAAEVEKRLFQIQLANERKNELLRAIEEQIRVREAPLAKELAAHQRAETKELLKMEAQKKLLIQEVNTREHEVKELQTLLTKLRMQNALVNAGGLAEHPPHPPVVAHAHSFAPSHSNPHVPVPTAPHYAQPVHHTDNLSIMYTGGSSKGSRSLSTSKLLSSSTSKKPAVPTNLRASSMSTKSQKHSADARGEKSKSSKKTSKAEKLLASSPLFQSHDAREQKLLRRLERSVLAEKYRHVSRRSHSEIIATKEAKKASKKQSKKSKASGQDSLRGSGFGGQGGKLTKMKLKRRANTSASADILHGSDYRGYLDDDSDEENEMEAGFNERRNVQALQSGRYSGSKRDELRHTFDDSTSSSDSDEEEVEVIERVHRGEKHGVMDQGPLRTQDLSHPAKKASPPQQHHPHHRKNSNDSSSDEEDEEEMRVQQQAYAAYDPNNYTEYHVAPLDYDMRHPPSEDFDHDIGDIAVNKLLDESGEDEEEVDILGETDNNPLTLQQPVPTPPQPVTATQRHNKALDRIAKNQTYNSATVAAEQVAKNSSAESSDDQHKPTVPGRHQDNHQNHHSDHHYPTADSDEDTVDRNTGYRPATSHGSQQGQSQNQQGSLSILRPLPPHSPPVQPKPSQQSSKQTTTQAPTAAIRSDDSRKHGSNDNDSYPKIHGQEIDAMPLLSPKTRSSRDKLLQRHQLQQQQQQQQQQWPMERKDGLQDQRPSKTDDAVLLSPPPMSDSGSLDDFARANFTMQYTHDVKTSTNKNAAGSQHQKVISQFEKNRRYSAALSTDSTNVKNATDRGPDGHDHDVDHRHESVEEDEEEDERYQQAQSAKKPSSKKSKKTDKQAMSSKKPKTKLTSSKSTVSIAKHQGHNNEHQSDVESDDEGDYDHTLDRTPPASQLHQQHLSDSAVEAMSMSAQRKRSLQLHKRARAQAEEDAGITSQYTGAQQHHYHGHESHSEHDHASRSGTNAPKGTASASFVSSSLQRTSTDHASGATKARTPPALPMFSPARQLRKVLDQRIAASSEIKGRMDVGWKKIYDAIADIESRVHNSATKKGKKTSSHKPSKSTTAHTSNSLDHPNHSQNNSFNHSDAGPYGSDHPPQKVKQKKPKSNTHSKKEKPSDATAKTGDHHTSERKKLQTSSSTPNQQLHHQAQGKGSSSRSSTRPSKASTFITSRFEEDSSEAGSSKEDEDDAAFRRLQEEFATQVSLSD